MYQLIRPLGVQERQQLEHSSHARNRDWMEAPRRGVAPLVPDAPVPQPSPNEIENAVEDAVDSLAEQLMADVHLHSSPRHEASDALPAEQESPEPSPPAPPPPSRRMRTEIGLGYPPSSRTRQATNVGRVVRRPATLAGSDHRPTAPSSTSVAPGPVTDPVTGMPLNIPETVVNDVVEFVTSEEAHLTSRARRMEVLRTRIVDTQTMRSERNADCILCSFGNRTVDASNMGSRLFVEMGRLLEKNYTTCAPLALVWILKEFYERKIVPLFEIAQGEVRLPPFVPECVYEHINTNLHTMNGHIFVASKVRTCQMLEDGILQHVFTRDNRIDLKAAEFVRKIIETQVKLMTLTPAKFAFGQSMADDVRPDVVAHMSSAVNMAREGSTSDYRVSTLQWANHLNDPPTPDTPSETAAQQPMSPPLSQEAVSIPRPPHTYTADMASEDYE